MTAEPLEFFPLPLAACGRRITVRAVLHPLMPNMAEKKLFRKAWKLLPKQFALALLFLMASKSLLITATDQFRFGPWKGYPDLGFVLLFLSVGFLLGVIGFLAWQMSERKRHPYPRVLIALLTIGIGLWSYVAGGMAAVLEDWVPYGIDARDEVQEQKYRPGIEVSHDGTTIIMRMQFVEGVADRIKLFLRDNPKVTTIELSGPGGNAEEGWKLARLIRQRGLDTRVQRSCASACAVAFVAGRRRELEANTGIGYVGFHPTSTIRNGKWVKAEGSKSPEEMRISGASEAFIWRIDQTSIFTVWRPTPAEFAAGGIPVVTLSGWEIPSDKWGIWADDKDKAIRSIDRYGEITSVLKEHEPDVLDDVVAWKNEAERQARNPWLANEVIEEALGRVLAYRLSLAGDAEVRKAGTYVRATMLKVRDTSSGICARLGDRPNLFYASRKVTAPPDSSSDPVTPYRSLVRRAYGEARHQGWPKGIGLPDVHSPETWARRGPPPRIATTCDEMVAWYDRALEPGSREGAQALRKRFGAFAGAGDALVAHMEASAVGMSPSP